MTTAAMRQREQAVDRQIGLAVRNRRTELGFTQNAVAEILGVTFQQLQKMEKGDNRIGAARLHFLAIFLQVPIGYFYERLELTPEACAGERPSRLAFAIARGSAALPRSTQLCLLNLLEALERNGDRAPAEAAE